MARFLESPSIPSSLSSVLKSYSFSLFVHASLFAALYVIPATTTQRFSQPGKNQVIAIEATQQRSALETPVSIDTESALFSSDFDSRIERTVRTEPAIPREFVDSLRRSQRREVPQLSLPQNLPIPSTENTILLKRRSPVEQDPQVTDKRIAPRLKRPRSIAEPPTPVITAIDQSVGLEEKTFVDLSANQPPAYPLEAIRKRLEGVVTLRLSINSSGAVTGVEVIESSGHRILDQAAVNAVSRWKGTPATRWGRSVASTERLPIRFRL